MDDVTPLTSATREGDQLMAQKSNESSVDKGRRIIIVVGFGHPGAEGSDDDVKRAKVVYRTFEQIFAGNSEKLYLVLAGPLGIVESSVPDVTPKTSSMTAAQLAAREFPQESSGVYCLPLNDNTPSLLPWLYAFANSRLLKVNGPILHAILNDIKDLCASVDKNEIEKLWAAAMSDLKHQDQGVEE